MKAWALGLLIAGVAGYSYVHRRPEVENPRPKKLTGQRKTLGAVPTQTSLSNGDVTSVLHLPVLREDTRRAQPERAESGPPEVEVANGLAETPYASPEVAVPMGRNGYSNPEIPPSPETQVDDEILQRDFQDGKGQPNRYGDDGYEAEEGAPVRGDAARWQDPDQDSEEEEELRD